MSAFASMAGDPARSARAMLAPLMCRGAVPARLDRRTRSRSPAMEGRTICRRLLSASMPGASALSPVGAIWAEAQAAVQCPGHDAAQAGVATQAASGRRKAARVNRMGLSSSNERKGAGLATGPRLLGGGSEIRADARQYGPPRIVDRIGRIIIFEGGANRLVGDVQHIQRQAHRSEEHTSELQSLMRTSYAVFCLKK